MRGVAEEVPGRTWRPVLGRWLVWLVVAGGLVVAATYGVDRYRQAKAAAAAPEYFTVAASLGPVQVSVPGSGSVQAVATQNVTPQTAGEVARVDVAVGQRVAAGTPLVDLADTQGLAQQVVAAQAALDQAKAQLQALTSPTLDPRTLAAAQLKVSQAELTLSQAQLTQSRDAAAAAAATSVITPVAGVVQSVGVVAGQEVGPGTQVAVVQPAGAPTITVPVPEEDLPYLTVGAAATIDLPSAAQVFDGTVTALGNTPSTSGTVTLGQSGGSAKQGSAATQTQQLYPVTVTPSTPIGQPPVGATATVTFTPSGTPPAAFGWSDAGQVTYPAPVDVMAQAAGTVGSLASVGASVSAGQQLAQIQDPATQTTAQQDQLNVQQDRLAVRQAQLALSQTAHPTPPTAAAVAAQQAGVQSDLLVLQQRQQALGELTVRAPMAGTVTAIAVLPGQGVGTGTTVVTLESAAGLQVVAPVDELDIGKVKVGEPVAISVSAFPGVPYRGKVVAIAPSATSTNGVSTYPVTMSLQSSQNLRPGMSATAVIQIASAARTLRVPAQAVTTFGAGGRGVVRVIQGGKEVPVPVKVGLIGTTFTQILSGLKVGERVVAGQASSGTTNPFAFFRGAGGGFRGPGPRGGGPKGG